LERILCHSEFSLEARNLHEQPKVTIRNSVLEDEQAFSIFLSLDKVQRVSTSEISIDLVNLVKILLLCSGDFGTSLFSLMIEKFYLP